MNPDKNQAFEYALFDFNEDGQAQQVTLPAKFPVDESVEPLFAGNLVSKPLAIAKEGTYVKLFNDGRKVVAKKIRITKADLEAMVANAKRDVPLNLDHFQGGPNEYGWVRAKTLPMRVEKDADGRAALYAQVEVTPLSAELVEKGKYRDFSPELDLMQKRLRGLAFTNYPVMQEIHQFSDEVVDSQPDFSEEPVVDIEAMKAELVAQLQAEFSEKLSALEAQVAAEREARLAAEREATTHRLALEFSDRVNKLIKDEEGKSRILPAQAEAVLNLYLFAAQHEESVIEFGEGEQAKSVSPVTLLDEVFSALPAIKLLGQEVDEGVSVEPEEFSEESSNLDVKAIARLAASRIVEKTA